MLSSILLHLNGDDASAVVVRGGVQLARRHNARVRGLAIADTRQVSASLDCESAAYLAVAQERLEQTQSAQAARHSELAQSSLELGVDFDVRRAEGNPLELLPRESHFHDLIVTGCPRPAGDMPARAAIKARIRDVTRLLLLGVQPLLVLRDEQYAIRRVLLVYDGTPTSGHAVKSYFRQQLWPDAELRLLAIGKSADDARRNLREMADYVRVYRSDLETGILCGTLRQALPAYADKWQADALVLGLPRTNPLVRCVWGEVVTHLLQRSTAALYLGN